MSNYQEVVKRIIDEVDIVDVISSYIEVVHKGTSYKAVCPFHNDTNPSLSISPKKKFYKCFSCGNGGNVIKFVENFEKVSYFDAIAILAPKIGLNFTNTRNKVNEEHKVYYQAMDQAVKYYQFVLMNTLEGTNALKYLQSRGIGPELINRFKIGLAPSEPNYLHLALNQANIDQLTQKELGLVIENQDQTLRDLFRTRIIFPISDQYQRFVALSGRVYLDNDQNPKYINSIENPIFHKNQVLYNLGAATGSIKKENRVFILEGFMDVIALAKAQIDNCVATMGTAFTNNHLKQILGLTKNIVLCFDGDSAGINATKRCLMLFKNQEVVPYAVSLPERLDPDDYLNKYGPNRLQNILNQNQTTIYEYLYQYYLNQTELSNPQSVIAFKKEIMMMLNYVNDQTYADFYLQKLAELLKVSREELTSQWQRGQKTITETTPPTDVESVIITNRLKAHELALIKIIEFCVYHRKFYLKYLDYQLDMEYCSKIEPYLEILRIIGEIYNLSDVLKIDLKVIKSKINNEYSYNILNKIENDQTFNPENNLEFDQCLLTLLKYFIEDKIFTLKQKIVLGEADLSEYLNAKKELKKIITGGIDGRN